jgi:hypothetical protein
MQAARTADELTPYIQYNAGAFSISDQHLKQQEAGKICMQVGRSYVCMYNTTAEHAA